MAKVGTINTIAAAGSESSGATVLVDDIDTHLKKAMMYPPVGRPVFAIMNPELTYSVSAYQTAAGGVDIFSHTFERFFVDNSNYLGDQFASGLLRSVVKYTPIALELPEDYEARAELMLAAAFSHNDVTGIGGRSGGMFIAHALEAYLSASYDTPHGAGLAITMPAWLQYIVENGDDDKVARVAQFAASVFDVQPDMQDIKAVANEGIRRFRAWIKSIGMPLTLSEMNISAKDLPEIVKNCRSNANGILEGYMTLDKKDVEKIYRSVI
jgi:hypothetical protein